MTPSHSVSIDLLLGKNGSASRWQEIFTSLFNDRMDPNTSKRILLLLAKKGEETAEIRGCLAAVRQFEPSRRLALPQLVDVCGTGGDGKKTFNVSTISAFVVAGAGGYVAKHGNRAVSSRSGSSDLMEALGIRLNIPFARMMTALRQFHLAYFHAPLYHPSFSRVQGVRKELGIRTLFNLLGPLLNPVQLSHQIIGVSNPRWLAPIAETLSGLGRKRAAVFRSRDGMDELSTEVPNDILYIEGKRIARHVLNPKKFGFQKVRERDYLGGDVKINREIALGILKGHLKGAQRDIVALNSGFALHTLGLASSLAEGIEKSRWTIRTGRALQTLEALKEFTNRRN